MSGMVSGVATGSFGLLQQLVANSTATSRKLAQLTTQSETGYVSGTYAGLETAQPGSANQALALGAQLDGINTTVSNLKIAAGQMDVQQSTISAISDIASKVLSQFDAVNALTPQAMGTTAATARNALTQIANLLNTQDGTRYVFAGQDSATPPIPNANSILTSSFFTNIQSATGTLSISAVFTAAGAPANSPFSASLASNPGAPAVAGANGDIITTGITANMNEFIGPSSGSNTTGSYMQDVLTTLSAIGSLSSTQVKNTNFATFAGDISTSLGNAINSMAQDTGVLGNNQSLLATQSIDLQRTAGALSNQLANTDQVDMTKTLSQLSATQTQLQASYQLIATMKTMSLTQYI